MVIMSSLISRTILAYIVYSNTKSIKSQSIFEIFNYIFKEKLRQ